MCVGGEDVMGRLDSGWGICVCVGREDVSGRTRFRKGICVCRAGRREGTDLMEKGYLCVKNGRT